MQRRLEQRLPRARAERLMAIDFRIFFIGELRRSDLAAHFGVTAVSVTRDIAFYKNELGGRIELDATEKIYRPAPAFKPLFSHNVERALRTLSKGTSDGALAVSAPLVRSDVPPAISLPKVEILAAVSRAVHRKHPLRIRYHSFESGETEREIVPFALADNGLRWHTRAFDRRRNGFVDFVLTRIEQAEEIIDGPIATIEMPEHDLQWNRVIELELVPHPKEKRQNIIAMDYDMKDGVFRVRLRAAITSYLLRQWIVDCTPDHSLTEPEYRLWLRNTPALFGVANAHLAPGYVKPKLSEQRLLL